ncbi:hypothetical protein PM082_024296 [Marasmius tenuissimus]|nr:hypothetical protein PM082_024296 [Marasmius tenuissimus]
MGATTRCKQDLGATAQGKQDLGATAQGKQDLGATAQGKQDRLGYSSPKHRVADAVFANETPNI